MTELLEQAIAPVRQLLSGLVPQRSPPEPFDPETRSAILEGCAQADRGEFVSDEDMAAFFAQRGA